MSFHRSIALTLFALIALTFSAPVLAQGDATAEAPINPLTEEESALIERLNTLLLNNQNYESYISTFASENSQFTSIDVPSMQLLQTQSQVISTFSTREISLEGLPYGRATLLTNTLITDGEETLGYELSGDLRFVDGRLFINATSTNTEEDTSGFLPAEYYGVWQEIVDPGSLLDLGIANFNGLFADTTMTSENELLLGLITSATSIRTESLESDGETLELITVAFDGVGFATFLAQTNPAYDPDSDAVTATLFSEIEAITDTVLELVIIVDGQERIIGRAVEANLSLTLDTQIFGVEADDGRFLIEFGISQSEELSAINEPIAVVTVPTGFENPPEPTAFIGPMLPPTTTPTATPTDGN